MRSLSLRKSLLLVCVVLLITGRMSAHAFSPTPSPTPSQLPTPTPMPIMSTFSVRVFNDGKWIPLVREVLSLHENHMYVDGVLAFVPLFEYVKETELPEIGLAEDFSYCVDVIDPALNCSYDATLYDQEGNLIASNMPVSQMLALDPGKYLMFIYISASYDTSYASTASLFWLNIDI